MTTRGNMELNLVEAMEPGPECDRASLPLPSEHRVSTAQEVLGALKATKGGASVIERVPTIERLEAWEEVAYFDVRGWSGAATALMLWDADFDGFFGMQMCLDNNFALFTGASWDTSFGAPGTATGRACCFFEAPRTDYYIFNVQLDSLLSGFEPSPPVVAFFMDDIPMGELQWEGSINQPLAALVAEGFHRFDVRQVSESFHFRSVTIWKSAIRAPEGGVARQ